MVRVIKRVLFIIITFTVISCSNKLKLDSECKNKLVFLKSKLTPIKGEKNRVWKLNFVSKENEAQHKEFQKLANDVIFNGEYNCLIGLNKDVVIQYLGKPSSNEKYYIAYKIKLSPNCGIKMEQDSDLLTGDSAFCNLLEFTLENDTIKSVYFDPNELGW